VRVSLLGLRIVVSAVPLRREYAQQVFTSSLSSASDRLQVPGESPAYHCSDPGDDIFQIRRLDFIPTNPRMFVDPIPAALFKPL
jgi:hypothetical protein